VLQDRLTEVQAWSQGPAACAVRIFCQDERRFGLLPSQRRQITLTGVKPLGFGPYRFENFSGYGAVEPTTGASFFLE
jgi:hypothetical protein